MNLIVFSSILFNRSPVVPGIPAHGGELSIPLDREWRLINIVPHEFDSFLLHTLQPFPKKSPPVPGIPATGGNYPYP